MSSRPHFSKYAPGALVLLGLAVPCGAPLQAAAAPAAIQRAQALDAISVAETRVRATFIIRASELAADLSGSDRVKRLAAAQRAEQGEVLRDLDTPGSERVAAAEPEELTTGRSVASAASHPSSVAVATDVLMPLAALSLQHLAATRGPAFDELYGRLMRAVLADLAQDYAAALQNGRDPALQAVAARELPRVKAAAATLP
jgi:predicted outer membrane protein